MLSPCLKWLRSHFTFLYNIGIEMVNLGKNPRWLMQADLYIWMQVSTYVQECSQFSIIFPKFCLIFPSFVARWWLLDNTYTAFFVSDFVLTLIRCTDIGFKYMLRPAWNTYSDFEIFGSHTHNFFHFCWHKCSRHRHARWKVEPAHANFTSEYFWKKLPAPPAKKK